MDVLEEICVALSRDVHADQVGWENSLQMQWILPTNAFFVDNELPINKSSHPRCLVFTKGAVKTSRGEARVSSVSIVIMLQAGCPGDLGSISGRVRAFYLFHCILSHLPADNSSWGLKLSSIILRLRIYGSYTSTPHGT